MTSFYTRKGDDGTTGVLGPGRVSKTDARMEALGSLDEASAALGMVRSFALGQDTAELVMQAQRDLYGLMGEVAATPENAETFRAITPQRVAWLEAQVDALSAQVSLPREFIVPGDTRPGAFLALARTIVRRAERRVAVLVETGELQNPELLRYLNRLSSLCFVLELYESQAAGRAGPTLAKD